MSVCLSSMKEIESKRTKDSYRTRPSLETMKNLTTQKTFKWCELKYVTTITSNPCTPRQQYSLYVTVTTLEASLVSNHQLQVRACLHGGGGPQVGEVARGRKIKRVYMQSYNPGVLGRGFSRLLLRLQLKSFSRGPQAHISKKTKD